MLKAILKQGLTVQILIGMLVGVLIGVFLRTLFGEDGDFTFSLIGISVSLNSLFVEGIFHVIGTIFVNSLKMLVVPLVLISLVCGVSGLADPSKLGRLGGKSVLLYISTTCIAITLALVAAMIVNPGAGFTMPTETNYVAKESPGLAQVIINMFPSNPFASMVQSNMLQIIVFAILFGIAITKAGSAGEKIRQSFEALNKVVMKIVLIVMSFAPIGVLSLMAKMSASVDLSALGSILKYFVLVLFVLVLHAFVTFPVLLATIGKLNPIHLLIKMKDAAMFAFSSSSSSATLPVTMQTARTKLGVNRSVASFTLPLGATINMDGTAIMQGVATVFIAQVYGVDLSTSDLIMVVLTATLASVGTAGVPGVGLIMLAMVLQQVNLPVDGIALIIGIDRLLDMTRTVVNVTGDCTIACLVAKSENELDEKVYNSH